MTVLPKKVVTEDRRLEKTADSTALALMQHRWHWTLDESNPKRVSMREYARQVGKTHSTILRYAKGYELVSGASRCTTPTEALQRAGMSTEQAAATEAVAESRGVTFNTARQSHPEEVRRIRDESAEPVQARQYKDTADPYRDLTRAWSALSAAHAHVAWDNLGKLPAEEVPSLRDHYERVISQATDIHEALCEEARLREQISAEIDRDLASLNQGGTS
jgi:hypothetical protein